MDPVLTAAGGILLGLVLKYFWDQLPWSREYVTRKYCDECRDKCTVKHSERDVDLEKDLKIMKEILLELAVKSGIPVEKYKRLMR